MCMCVASGNTSLSLSRGLGKAPDRRDKVKNSVCKKEGEAGVSEEQREARVWWHTVVRHTAQQPTCAD